MKKSLLLSALVSLTLAAISCAKETQAETPADKGSITIQSSEDLTPVFDTKGGNKAVAFTASKEWTASVINDKADGWLSLSPISGNKGENTLFISATENTGNEDRSATVEIRCGEAKRQIIATQKQKNALTVTQSKFEVGAKGGIVTVEVKANVDYTVTVDDKCAQWIDKVQSKSMVTTTVKLSVAENEELEKRDGKVIISSGNLSEIIYIYQAGAAPAIILGQNEYVIPSAGETITVTVSHNVNATCVMPQVVSWISEVKTKAMSTNTYQFEIAENKGYDNREAEIKFVNIENGLSEAVKVIQMQKDEIVVAKREYELNDKGGDIVVRVGHNIDFDIDINGTEWISKVEPQTKSFVQEDITFHIAQNFAYDGREGLITFTSKDKSKQQVVRILQGQVNAIILDLKSRIVPADGESFSVDVNANVELSVRPQVSWIHQITTKSLVSSKLDFVVDANTSYYNREGKIIVLNTLKNVADTLVVTQLQKDAIVAAKSEYNVERKGGTITVGLSHNVQYLPNINVGWISEVNTKAFVTDNLTYEISENTTGSDRTGKITFTSYDGKASQTITVIQDGTDVKDLSKEGTANCYIVPKAGAYKFKATVKGNSTETVGTPAVAEVLWESFGTDVKPNVGEIIASVNYSDGYVTLTTPSTLANGNAVVAVKDASGTILWSWHLWVCKDFDPNACAHTYANNAGIMMDRHLGALSSEKGNILSIGLVYEWGRKDPFLCSVSFTEEKTPGVSEKWPTFSGNQYTLDYSIQHPTTYIPCYSSYRYDWCNVDMTTRWNPEKTKYDPCPSGWKVPDSSFWKTAFGTSSTNVKDYLSLDKKGIILPSSISGEEAWYPYSGGIYAYSTSANVKGIASETHIWTSKPYVSSGNYFAYFFYYGPDLLELENTWTGNGSPAYGFSVRCQKQ